MGCESQVLRSKATRLDDAKLFDKKDPGDERMSQTLNSVDNALRMLHLLRRNGPMRMSEIAEQLGIGNSTAHRLLTTLREQRFVRQESRGKRYELGPAMLFTAGGSAVEHCVITAVPIMNRLRDAIEETVHLSSLRGTDVIFLAAAESNRLTRVTTRVGRRPKAHATAAGKVLLAALEPEQLQELYPEESLESHTPRTETSRAKLFDELETVRALGYARNLGESELDMHTIAVAIRRPNNAVVCALAISTLLSRVEVRSDGELSTIEQEHLSSLQNAKQLIESWLAF